MGDFSSQDGLQQYRIHLDVESMYPPSPEIVYRELITKVPRGSAIHFVVDTGSKYIDWGLTLYTNYPPNSEKFDRGTFYECKGATYDGRNDWIATIHDNQGISRSGCFEYYLQFTAPNDHSVVKSFVRTFNVDPAITLKGKLLKLDGLVIQTVVTKFLGGEKRCKQICQDIASNGYNSIHFTPIQELGQSQSSYSLYDQLSVTSSLFGNELNFEARTERLRQLLSTLENDFGLLSVTDVVWNHTANNSPWLAEHPEAGYNLQNSPHLKAAFELDEALMNFSDDLVSGKYHLPDHRGPDNVTLVGGDDDVRKILHLFRIEVWPKLRLWEYFTVDVDASVDNFRRAVLQNIPFDLMYSSAHSFVYHDVKNLCEYLRLDGLFNTGHGERFSNQIKNEVALALFNVPKFNAAHQPTEEVERKCTLYRNALDLLNDALYKQVDEDLSTILHNLFYRMKRGFIDHKERLFESYFTRISTSKGLVALANNGWIWAGNPLTDFASPSSRAYFRRDVIIWADSVKLRYGRGPEDNPWLWGYMRKYTELMASMFHGFRIDNCHSTPVHLAGYLLDAARLIRPELYVTAELFTGSADLDGYWASKLGINSLIREAMAPYDSWELGRYVHRYGGSPVGSVRAGNFMNVRSGRSNVRELLDSPPGGLLMDCTHDNEVPNQKRTAADALPNAALVAMSACSIGSTRGYDELVPFNLNIVTEKRLYRVPEGPVGISAAKRVLNFLHREMSENEFSEVHVHQVENLIVVQRHNPKTHEAIYMLAFTAFSDYTPSLSAAASVVKIPAKIIETVIAASLSVPQQRFDSDIDYISGLSGVLSCSTDHVSFCAVHEVLDNGSPITEVQLHNFAPGSILAFRTSLFPAQFNNWKPLAESLYLRPADRSPVYSAVSSLSQTDLNALLYRCEEEEHARTNMAAYDLPDFGRLIYCGIAGIYDVVKNVVRNNDMGHPLCNNLRNGDWLLDYVLQRTSKYSQLAEVYRWMKEHFDYIRNLPRHLIPHYFADAIQTLFTAATQQALKAMSPFVRESNEFVESLSLCAVQLYGHVPDGPDSMAAGLPHFSSGYMRAWGRDTFISLRGLLLVTGRYAEAKSLLINFGSCLRHGLIPNLYDSGRNPRFNSRDSVWWYLQALQDYCEMAPEGVQVLSAQVPRFFPEDKIERYDYSSRGKISVSLADVVQEIMQKHADGIHFREWNAGSMIDAHMTDQGFNIDVALDKSTGLIFGGNQHNCGTWMDKMGESAKAGSKGFPSSPRDGAAIEIIGLLKSTLRWLSKISGTPEFSYSGVRSDTSEKDTFYYKDWNDLVQRNAERLFWVPLAKEEDPNYSINSAWVNRRGIYRDTHQSSFGWSDYQLRPNACVAMAVAPEMFHPEHARAALRTIEEVLVGPLGMKTLDPSDWNYRPNYDMSIDNEDRSTSKGFNYHQGPEWLWCLGYFLRAKLNFAENKQQLGHGIWKMLKPHRAHIAQSRWQGLPELTNGNGSPCYYSCPTQAWSAATALDALYDLWRCPGQ